MLTLVPVIKLDRKDLPAPAYTDYSNIFIAREANIKQEVLLTVHEQAHIWLNHKTRRASDFGTDTFNKKFWNMALEVEIARNVYSEDDEDEIKKPMTLISGGVVSDSFPKMPPEIRLAEDIYEWFKENPDEVPESKCVVFCSCAEDTDDDDKEPQKEKPTEAELKEIVEELKKTKELKLVTEAKKVNLKKLNEKKPSLASEIDYVLRKRKVKEKSFSRPSRREIDPFILKGTRKRKKSPRVEIFVDRSGSMSGERTGASEQKLKKILSKYRASIEHDVFYFSNGKMFNHDVPPRGSNPYPLVMAHLEKSRPLIAVILTDYDTSDTDGLTPLSHGVTKILCVPICADRTAIANLIGAKDVY